MKKVLFKSGEIKSLTGLYEAIQEASISNAKEYIKSFVIKPGLRLDGESWLVSYNQGSLVVRLGACVFNDYEVFVAPANTTVSLEMPEITGSSLGTEYAVVLERVDDYSHYKRIRPDNLPDLVYDPETPTLRKTGVIVKIVEDFTEAAENEILLATLHSIQGGVSITDKRSENCITIFSYYSSWGLSALVPITPSSVSTFILHNGANQVAPLESYAQSMAFITVRWSKPASIGLWEVRGPIYYKAVLTPISDAGEMISSSLEAYLPFDVDDESEVLSISIPCCHGVLYKAEVYQVAGPTNLVVSEAGESKQIVAGLTSADTVFTDLSLDVVYPGRVINGVTWQKDYFFIRPTSATAFRRYQLFVFEYNIAVGVMFSLGRLYYDGPPKGIYYKPSGTLSSVAFAARAIGESGVILSQTSSISFPQSISQRILSSSEDLLVLRIPVVDDVFALPAAASFNSGYVMAPYDLVIDKIAITNPFRGRYNTLGTSYDGITKDATVQILVEDADAGYPLVSIAEPWGDAIHDYDEMAVPEIVTGKKISVTIANPIDDITPQGLIVIIYVKRIIS